MDEFQAVDSLTANLPDLIVAGIVLVSAVFAFYRGFVRESLAIAGWVGAAFATIWLFPAGKIYAREWITPTWLADLLTGVGLFVVTLMALWLVIHLIVARVKRSPLNGLDRSLGFLFGLARGVVLIALAYMVATQAAWRDEEGPPAWVREARVLPLIDYSAGLIVALVPEGTFNLPVEGFNAVQSQAEQLKEAQRRIEQLQRLTDPPVAPPRATGGETGYKEADRKAMGRLLETLPDADSGQNR